MKDVDFFAIVLLVFAFIGLFSCIQDEPEPRYIIIKDDKVIVQEEK